MTKTFADTPSSSLSTTLSKIIKPNRRLQNNKQERCLVKADVARGIRQTTKKSYPRIEDRCSQLHEFFYWLSSSVISEISVIWGQKT